MAKVAPSAATCSRARGAAIRDRRQCRGDAPEVARIFAGLVPESVAAARSWVAGFVPGSRRTTSR